MRARGGESSARGARRSSAGWWTSTSAARCTRPRRCCRRGRSASWWRGTSICTCSRCTTARSCTRVETLRDQVARQRRDLVQLRQSGGGEPHGQAGRGGASCARCAASGRRTSQQVQRSAQEIQDRLARAARDGVAADERDRVDRERAAPERGDAARARPRESSTLRTSDLGQLDWPVDGTLLYRFGRVREPEQHDDALERRRHRGGDGHAGAGGGAGHGGERRAARHLRAHGDRAARRRRLLGLRLAQRVERAKSQAIRKGDVVGTVGMSDPELRPHLHFEIRPQGRAVDPESWLRERADDDVTKRCPVCGDSAPTTRTTSSASAAARGTRVECECGRSFEYALAKWATCTARAADGCCAAARRSSAL